MTASIRQVKARLSEFVTTAEQGEEVIITSNGKPRAKIVPVSTKAKAGFDWEKMRRLAERGSTGKRGPTGTEIISALRADR
jgi:prevent-host-death family protein